MPEILQINQIHKAYGANVILSDTSASFSTDQKIGMIGPNGAGKSTLCRIITACEAADDGTITRSAGLRLSYLEQHDVFKPGETALQFLMRTTNREHWECGMTAARFQIKNEMLGNVVQSMPGGYQTRLKLASMLLTEPNFLVLDEPSNFLDLATLILLENFLLTFKGGYLIVSHDREFLKRTCDHTLELEGGRLTLYPGDIEEYFEFKEEQITQAEAYNVGVRKKLDQLQVFVDRFRAKASTASRAQSKLKQMQKLKTIKINHQTSRVRIHLPEVPAKSGTAFSCENLTIGYPEKEVARGIHLSVNRGQHVAVLGDNGEGKTTLVRTIAGDLPARGGSYRWSAGLDIAYYAQHVFASLKPQDDIYAHLSRKAADGVSYQDIMAMAGCFLFKGDDVKKKVKVLSGGERARLVLAGLLLSKKNVLILDEPTNHLDFDTVEALGRALKRFAGVIFFISHDRTFVNLGATQIIEIKSGRVKRYPGTYEDYVYSLEVAARGGEAEPPSQDKAHLKKPDKQETSDHAKTIVKKSPQKSKPDPRALELKKNMDKLERRIKHFTDERNKLLEEIQANPMHFSKARNMRLKELEVLIEEAEAEWYAIQSKQDKPHKTKHTP
ncbi:MAG: ABC-F family ATP-binding cassette domain-containing protein [Candidatus Omnitrophica bacterium]|nr:ABC-F family ATP-binding cassette domain-containing protein [Candidatus Omnitrophota bacterium]